MPEFGIQCGLGVVASLPNPIRNSSDATRTKNVVTKAETEAKRHLESIAREQCEPDLLAAFWEIDWHE